ncbi:MAG: 3-keto-5-aminohexanoate cleavage protein [Betaproteobacteria bacterium]
MSRPKHKVGITCSIKGAIHTPSMSPYFPITPGEFAQATDHERLKARFNELLLKIIVL